MARILFYTNIKLVWGYRLNKQLFFVSTLGQARNARNIIEALEDRSNSLVVVLWTQTNLLLADRITKSISSTGIHIQRMELPVRPAFITVGKLYQFRRKYTGLLKEHQPQEIWIANANIHYAYLAFLSKRNGIDVCYFEEGLGTYKRKSYIEKKNISLSLTQKLRTLKQPLATYIRTTYVGSVINFFRNIIRIIYKEFVGIWLVLSGITNIVSNILATSKPSLRFLRWALPEGSSDFLNIATEYKKVSVAFPASLDPDLYRSDIITTLPINVDKQEREDTAQALLALPGRKPKVIYISQNYGGRSPKFYAAVAACIKESGVKHIALKFHPKEKQDLRGYLLAELELAEIKVLELDTLSEVPAETVLATGIFHTVMGITSSTLFYGSLYKSVKTQHSIAPELIEKLTAKNFNSTALATLKLDTELLTSLLET